MKADKETPITLESRVADAGRLFSPSAGRNRDAILAAFLKHAPERGAIVEVGSGSGEHVVHLAAAAPALNFHPGDPDKASRHSIAAWTAHAGLSNIAAPHAADVSREDWHQALPEAAGVLSCNMVHIAPFEAAEGLVSGAAALLARGGRLFLYGPFARNGAHTAPSNAAFDATLKSRDPRWGVRDLDRQISPLARAAGFELAAIEEMPANNLFVVFVRR